MRGLTAFSKQTSPPGFKSRLKLPGVPIPCPVTEKPVPKEPPVYLRTKTFGKLRAVQPAKDSPTVAEKREQFRRNTPRRHTLAISSTKKKDGDKESSQEEMREAFKDMLTKRFNRRPDRADTGSTGSEGEGIYARPAPGRRRPERRKTTVVTYNPDSSRSTDQDERNTSMSEVESEASGPGLQRGGSLRSSLPIVRSPNHSFERSLGLVFLIYGDETKRCPLPNEITHLDTVRALFVKTFADKLNMPLVETRPQLKVYIQDKKSKVFYQLEDLRDIRENTILKLHYCDSAQPQKVKEYPKVRGKTILSPTPPPSKSPTPRPDDRGLSGISEQTGLKSKSLPNRNLLDPSSHPQQMRDHPDLRYRPLTPDVAHTSPDTRWRQISQDDHRRMLPERPFSPDRLALGTIPENRQPLQGSRKQPSTRDLARSRSAQSTPIPMMEIMVPNSGRSTPTASLPLHHYAQKYHSVSPSGEIMHHNSASHRSPPDHYARERAQPGYHSDNSPHVKPGPLFPPQAPMYVAKGVRASTCSSFSPLRATGPPHQRDPRVPPIDRATQRHSLSAAPVAGMPPIHRQPVTRGPHDRTEVARRPQNLGPSTSASDGNICQRSQSYRVPGDRNEMRIRPRSVTPQPQDYDPESRHRIEKMEAQLANLTAWVHSTVSTNGNVEGSSRASSMRSLQSSSARSSSSGGSLNDLSTISKQTQTLIQSSPLMSREMAHGLLMLHKRTIELKVELKGLRRLQQLNMEGARESIEEVYGKIKFAITAVPGVNNKPVRQMRFEADTKCDVFKQDKERVHKELRDLEASVEEMRSDVISRQCRVNMTEVEGMALALSQITKSLADLKGRLPSIIDLMKTVMSGEMEVVVSEESFVKTEPESIESCLKKCKKLTGTLFTMKRLASVQEHRIPQVPVISTNGQTGQEKNNILENIQSMIPNHDARLQSLEAADASRERKRRLASQQEALKFEKKLEMATKNLKSGSGKTGGESSRSTPVEGLQSARSSEQLNDLNQRKCVPRSRSLDQDTDDNDPDSLSYQKQIARAEFFRSLSVTPPRSLPTQSSPKQGAEMDFVVHIPKSQPKTSSPDYPNNMSSPTNSSDKLPESDRNSPNGQTPEFTSSQSPTIAPKPTQRTSIKSNQGDEVEKKKQPPPPPPRSSLQSQPSFSSFYSTITSPSKLDCSSADQTNANFKSGRASGLPISSTPLVGGPKKPLNNFEKGIMNVVYVNVHPTPAQEPTKPIVRSSNIIESPSDNGNDQESEGESTSSVDSQNEVWRLRTGSKGESSRSTQVTSHGLPRPDLRNETKVMISRRKPPPPPQRKSSVLTRRNLQEQTTKTYHLHNQHQRLEIVETEQDHLSKQHQILEEEQKQLKGKRKP